MHAYGVHLEQEPLFAHIRKRGKTVEILSLSEKKIPPSFKKNLATSGISARYFTSSSFPQKLPEEVLLFQAKAKSYLPENKALFIPHCLKNAPQRVYSLLKKPLAKHLEELRSYRIEPQKVSTIPNALCRFFLWKFPHVKNALLFHIGKTEITLVQIEGGSIAREYPIFYGISHLFSALLKDRKKALLQEEVESAAKHLDVNILKPNLHPCLFPLLQRIQKEVKKTLYSLFGEKDLPPVFCMGYSDAFFHLEEFFFENFEKNAFTREEKPYAVAIGLALEGASKNSLQLLQEEFFPKKTWKKLGLYSVISLLFSLSLSLGVSGYGKGVFAKKTQSLLEKAGIEKSAKDIDTWITSIEKEGKKSPYIPQIPKALDILHWIATDPFFQSQIEKNDPIRFEKIHYQLTSYPTPKAPREKFSAKVTLTFSCQNATSARRFHKELSSENSPADTSKEISWEVLEDGYRTGFTLKEKKPHVL